MNANVYATVALGTTMADRKVLVPPFRSARLAFPAKAVQGGPRNSRAWPPRR